MAAEEGNMSKPGPVEEEVLEEVKHCMTEVDMNVLKVRPLARIVDRLDALYDNDNDNTRRLKATLREMLGNPI